MKNCLFCDTVVSIKKMLDHVAAHLERGDPMPNANKGGDHEACGFCGQTDGQCKTELAGKTVKSTCLYASRLHYSTALKNFRNVPQQCPVPGCMATPFTLNIRKHFERSHPRTNIGGYDISGWVVKLQARTSASSHRRSRTKTCAPRVTVVKEAATASTDSASSSNAGGDMFRGQQRADSDWQTRSEGSEEEETNEEGSSSSVASSSSSTSQSNSASSSSTSAASSSKTSSTEEVQAPGRCKKLTKTRTTVPATRSTATVSSAPAAKRKNSSPPSVAAKQRKT